MTATIRAFGYIRVSDKDLRRLGHSIELQPERIRAWCVARGLELVGLYEDNHVSGGKLLHKRPAGADMLARYEAGDADVIVVVALDRLFRNAREGLNRIYDDRGNVRMHVQSVTEPIDTTTAMGRFITTVWLGKAQLEREQASERNAAIADGLRRSARAYGHVPFGCQLVEGRLYRHPDHWPVRESIVVLAAQGKGVRAIASHLTDEGVPTPQGGARWSKNTVGRVIDSHDGLNHIPALPSAEETGLSTEPTA